MAINVDDFLDEYIAELEALGADFSPIETTSLDAEGNVIDVTIDVEAEFRQKLGLLATEWNHHVGEENTVISTNTTLTDNISRVVLADASGGDVTITLPAASVVSGKTIKVKRTDSSANIVTVSGSIDGGSSFVLYEDYGVQSFFSDGTAYWTLDSHTIVQRGTETFAASSSQAISFPDAMPSTDYRVTVEVSGNPGGGWWITAKGTGGFTLNFSGSVSLDARWEARI